MAYVPISAHFGFPQVAERMNTFRRKPDPSPTILILLLFGSISIKDVDADVTDSDVSLLVLNYSI